MPSIDADPDNLTAVNTLAGMGVLTNDDDLVDAALSEILALPLDQRYSRDPQRDVAYLLIQHHIGQVRIIISIALAICLTRSLSIARSDSSTVYSREGCCHGACSMEGTTTARVSPAPAARARVRAGHTKHLGLIFGRSRIPPGKPRVNGSRRSTCTSDGGTEDGGEGSYAYALE